MKVFTTLSAVMALASAESDAFFPHGGIRPLAQQQMRQATIQLRPVQSTYGNVITQGPTVVPQGVQVVPQGVQEPLVVAGANAAAAAAAAAGTPVSPRFTYFEVNQQMQQPAMVMREGEMFEYDVNYVETKKKPDGEKQGSVDSVINMKEGEVYRFQKGDYDVKVNIKGVEASSYRKPEDKERDVEVKINGHAKSQQDKTNNQKDALLDGRRRVVDVGRSSTERSRMQDEDEVQQTHDVQVKIKSASGSRKQNQHTQQQGSELVQQTTQKNEYRARQDFDDHERRLMSYHRLDQDRMRHHPMTDRRMSHMDMSERRNDINAYNSGMDINDRHMAERQMTADRHMTDRHMADRQMGADRHMSDRHLSRYQMDAHMPTERQMSDRHMTDRQMTDRQMTERQMSVERHMTDRQMGADRHMSDRHLSRHQMDGGHMPGERRVYDERLRMMSDRRMHDRRLTDRRHLLPAYRQRFNDELNEFNNAARRPISNNEQRSRLFKREAAFVYDVMASHPTSSQVYMMDQMMPTSPIYNYNDQRPLMFRGRQSFLPVTQVVEF